MLNLATASPRLDSPSRGFAKQVARGGTSSLAQVVQQGSETLRGVGEYSSDQYVTSAEARSLEEQLFDALAAAKIATATFAMHLPRAWRNKFFERLDRMHDAEDWEAEESLLNSQSVRTFLRAWLLLKPVVNPGFGMSVRGNLIAGWAHGDRRLTLEFFPRDLVSWLVMIPHPDDQNAEAGWVERGGGTNKLSDLLRVMQPYPAAEWMYGANRQDNSAS
jgi:hypothetical protein